MNNIVVALAGNPNSGKTTMFNALTGARQHVGNYPGVTVEKKEGKFKKGDVVVHLVDLPGTYSLTAYSEEELVAKRYVVEEKPHAVVQVVDATVLERSLYLTVQFMEMGVPVALALNMMDEVERKGMIINSEKLSSLLGIPVVETVARTGKGKERLIQEVINFVQNIETKQKPLEISYGEDVDLALKKMIAIINEDKILSNKYPARWIALKFLEGDSEVINEVTNVSQKTAQSLTKIVAEVSRHCGKILGTDLEIVIADHRYGFITSLIKQGVLRKKQDIDTRRAYSEQLDKVLTHKILGPIIMLAILYGLFQLTFTLGEVPMAWLEDFFGWIGNTASNLLPEGLLQSLVVSGIIDGVGGVMGFVPLILIMFIGISILEDFGYMARMAYMLDRVFRFFGLHGSSVMPFVVSGGIPGGCAVPGVMATRTLRSPKEKLATVLVSPFMVCGAKVPVFILLAAAFFPEEGADVLFWGTLFSWGMALITAKILRSTVIKGEPTPFVMELPPYRIPTVKGVLIHAWERAWQYIKKAGTVILGISILLWVAMTFPSLPDSKIEYFENQQSTIQKQLTTATDAERIKLQEKLADLEAQQAEAALEYSFAGRLGKLLEPVLSLAGFNWKTNIALIGGFAAKEVIVSTLGTAYSLGDVDPVKSDSLSERLTKDPQWSKAVALSVMVFVLLYAPCFVTVVAMAKETSWKWAMFGVLFNTTLAFIVSTITYHFTI
ncbi:ferrous iron transport protein B [Desulfovulcanus sp.]